MRNIVVNIDKITGTPEMILIGGALDGAEFPRVAPPAFPSYIEDGAGGPRYVPTHQRNARGLHIYKLAETKGGAL